MCRSEGGDGARGAARDGQEAGSDGEVSGYSLSLSLSIHSALSPCLTGERVWGMERVGSHYVLQLGIEKKFFLLISYGK